MKFNEVTWYSKLAALIFFLVVFPALTFYMGARYQEVKMLTEVREVSVVEEPVRITERYAARVDRVDVVFEHTDYTQYRLTTNGLVREGELNTERGFKDDIDATVYVLNWRQPEGEHIYYVRLTNDSTHLYVLDSNREIVTSGALTLQTVTGQ